MISLTIDKKIAVFALFIILAGHVCSQDDATWWNEVHNWDGVTSWTNYLITSPYYFGPNALPVPYSQKGQVKDRSEFKVEMDSHFSKGDKTQNLFMDLYIPLVRNKFAIDFYGVPVEHYKMNEATVIERRARNRKGSGYSAGDFYFSTIIQLIRNKKIPDIALRMACRTASGSGLSEARYTDAPGYFFDLSFGKDLVFNQKPDHKIRFYGMLGFYSWQMNIPNNRQNDALLFGAGMDFLINSWKIITTVDGYSGYIGHGKMIIVDESDPVSFNDRPAVYRLELVKEFKKLDFSIGYQIGVHDFIYQTLSLSILVHFQQL